MQDFNIVFMIESEVFIFFIIYNYIIYNLHFGTLEFGRILFWMLPGDRYTEWRDRQEVEENNHKLDFGIKENTL